MKICTDIAQSKKLIELGIDKTTADMMWVNDGLGEPFLAVFNDNINDEDVPAWSLSALLNLIMLDCKIEKIPVDQSGDFVYNIIYKDIVTDGQEDIVDACVDMLEKLKEIDLLP